MLLIIRILVNDMHTEVLVESVLMSAIFFEIHKIRRTEEQIDGQVSGKTGIIKC